MNNILWAKTKESIISVLPITLVIVFLNFVLPNPLSGLDFFSFVLGAVLLIVGMILYSLGNETALAPIGEIIGNKVTSTKKIPIILITGLIIGFTVTVAEPDLMVLGDQLGNIKTLIVFSIALGVGFFLMLALGRIIFKKLKLNYLLFIIYGIVFILAIFADNEHIGLAFDSGGVTTGPVTVPFIMALGAGVASILPGKDKEENSFGVVGICSVGPIFFVLLLSIIMPLQIDTSLDVTSAASFGDVANNLAARFATCFTEVAIALLPIAAIFFILNIFFLKTPKKRLIRIIIGLLYTFLGLTIFLCGVKLGFMSTGYNLGERIASLTQNWVLIPIGMLIGCFMVLAEPAVHVLARQVENLSDGNIKQKTMLIALCVSTVIAISLAMIRILTGISLWWFIAPGYAIALILSFFVPKAYTAIAFDSGGVASGPMATTFLLPLSIGAATALGSNVLTSAYGVIALVALTPLITIQVLGLIVKIKTKTHRALPKSIVELFEGGVVELNVE